MEQKEYIRKLGRKVKQFKEYTWNLASIDFNKEYSTNINGEQLRERYRRLNDDFVPIKDVESDKEFYETHNQDGTIEFNKEIPFDKEDIKTQEDILKLFGYNPDEWQVLIWSFGWHETALKTGEVKTQRNVKAKIKPVIKEHLSNEEIINITNELFKEQIKPIKAQKNRSKKSLNEDRLMECPPIELHLGELSCQIDCGENYDIKIAEKRFNQIIDEIIELNKYRKCSTLLFSVGGDFLNSDNNYDTTNKGTQQFNDTRWRKLYLTGLRLLKDALLRLSKEFNDVNVQLVGGNHDLTTSFYLYISLLQGLMNYKNIHFSDDYKEVQCYQFGDCMIVQTHGSRNINRTIQSIVNEFASVYGNTYFRELHLGHLHSNQELKEQCGIIPRRIGSPKGTGQWEYDERFSSLNQHTLFTWEKGKGMIGTENITFKPEKDEKKLIK